MSLLTDVTKTVARCVRRSRHLSSRLPGEEHVAGKKKFHPQLFVSKRPVSYIFIQAEWREPKRGEFLTYRSGFGPFLRLY